MIYLFISMVCVNPVFTNKHNMMVRMSQSKPALTLKHGEPLGLVVVDDGHTDGVQTHEAEDYPVEAVRLDHTTDGEAQHSLFTAKVGSRTPSHGSDVHRRSGTTWETITPPNVIYNSSLRSGIIRPLQQLTYIFIFKKCRCSSTFQAYA